MEDSGYGGGTHSVEGALLFKRIAITFDEMGATREGLREAQPLQDNDHKAKISGRWRTR